jgi:hypothetical protein
MNDGGGFIAETADTARHRKAKNVPADEHHATIAEMGRQNP